MKKLILLIIINSLSYSLFSQENEQKGKDVLKIISTETKSYQSMKIDFKLSIKSAEINESHKGLLFIKDNNFYYSTDDREVISDGESVWTFMNDENECYIDNIEDLSDGLNPSEIMTIWEDNFKINHVNESKVNDEIIHLIKLFPIDTKNSKYHTVILKVNETKKQIVSSTIKTKDGLTLLFLINKLTPNPNISSEKFQWNVSKHPGVEEIDNR